MNRFLKIPPALLAALVIFGAAVIAFSPALFRGKILAPLDITTTLLAPWEENAHGSKPHNHNPTDAVTQYLPYRIHAEKSLREDGYIGWNPYSMGGSSLAGNTMALPGSWTMQLHRFLRFDQAWNLGILAEFLIAGMGMLVFLRSRGLPWLACVLGAIAYMGNSQFIIWIYHRWALSSFCWMPWVLWSSAAGLSWRNADLRQWLLPVFLTLALLGSSLQHMVFVAIACGCIAGGGLIDFKTSYKQWPVIACWALAFVFALAMASFTIVPQVLAYLTNVDIGHVRGGIGYPEGPVQPAFNLLAIPAQIWPWLLGDPQTIDSWRLLKSGFMNLAYLGTIPMILAVAGLFVKSMPRQAKWLIVAGLLIPLTPLVGPLYHRVQLLFLLGGAWMAAEMMARLPDTSPKLLIRTVSLVVFAIGAALLVGTCLPGSVREKIENQVVAKSVASSEGSNFGGDKEWVARRARGWTDRFSLTHPRTAWVYGLLLLGSGGLILSSLPRTAHCGNVVILGTTSLELFTLFQLWTTFSDPRDLLPPHPAIERVRYAAGSNRVLQRNSEVPFADIFATPNLLSAYLIPSVDAYESIQYRSTSIALAKENSAMRLDLAGVGISVQPESSTPDAGTSDWPVSETISGYAIRKNPRLPAALAAGIGPVPETCDQAVAALNRAIPLQSFEQTMNHRSFEVPAGSTWVRISQNWHEGWRWKTTGGDWKPFSPGPDAACWITQPSSSSPSRIEARFFPRPNGSALFSVTAAGLWACLIPVIVLRSRRVSPGFA